VEELLNQISWAAEKGLYFLALAGALIIPDICGALEQNDGQASTRSYVEWFDRNLNRMPGGPNFDGESCYRFRCSLLHQGTTQHPKSRFKRVLFVEPGAISGVIHNIYGENALIIDVREFCLEMVRAAAQWKATVVGAEPYETNVLRFVTRYPTGLAPHIVGVPVIS